VLFVFFVVQLFFVVQILRPEKRRAQDDIADYFFLTPVSCFPVSFFRALCVFAVNYTP
jgi:hypothetical protein